MAEGGVGTDPSSALKSVVVCCSVHVRQRDLQRGSNPHAVWLKCVHCRNTVCILIIALRACGLDITFTYTYTSYMYEFNSRYYKAFSFPTIPFPASLLRACSGVAG